MKQKPYIQNQKLSVVRESTILYSEPIKTASGINRTVREIITPLGYDLSYQEHVFVLGLNTAMKVQLFAHISTGSTDSCLIDKKVLFSHLLLSNCQNLILIHNHPSGNMNPSQSDKNLTKQIKDGSELLGLKLLDHLILSGTNDDFYSLQNDGEI